MDAMVQQRRQGISPCEKTKTRLSEQERMVGVNKEKGIVMNNEIKTENKINLTMEFVENGAILEYPDCMKYVVEGYDKEPYHAIADGIQDTMSGMKSL